MTGGIWLRASGIAPERFIAVFYTGLGAALLLAGLLFGRNFGRRAPRSADSVGPVHLGTGSFCTMAIWPCLNSRLNGARLRGTRFGASRREGEDDRGDARNRRRDEPEAGGERRVEPGDTASHRPGIAAAR